jgi:AbrB family looped-hinge helix DNA binding protein
MPTATLTSKGQTTIPKAIRQRLRLKAGDRIDFVVEADGQVRLVARNLRLADLRGLLPKPKRRLSDRELDAAIRESWGARQRRLERETARKRGAR